MMERSLQSATASVQKMAVSRPTNLPNLQKDTDQSTQELLQKLYKNGEYTHTHTHAHHTYSNSYKNGECTHTHTHTHTTHRQLKKKEKEKTQRILIFNFHHFLQRRFRLRWRNRRRCYDVTTWDRCRCLAPQVKEVCPDYLLSMTRYRVASTECCTGVVLIGLINKDM